MFMYNKKNPLINFEFFQDKDWPKVGSKLTIGTAFPTIQFASLGGKPENVKL